MVVEPEAEWAKCLGPRDQTLERGSAVGLQGDPDEIVENILRSRKN